MTYPIQMTYRRNTGANTTCIRPSLAISFPTSSSTASNGRSVDGNTRPSRQPFPGPGIDDTSSTATCSHMHDFSPTYNSHHTSLAPFRTSKHCFVVPIVKSISHTSQYRRSTLTAANIHNSRHTTLPYPTRLRHQGKKKKQKVGAAGD